MIEQLPGNAEPFSPLLGTAARVVHHQKSDLGIDVSIPDRCCQGLEIASITRCHHAHSDRGVEIGWSS